VEVLSKAIQPPDIINIRAAVSTLLEAGALVLSTDSEHEITFIGRLFASLPVDIRISRLLLFGEQY
jgi:HrpA-like RNA helicase